MKLFALFSALFIIGCAPSIRPVGDIGPKRLQVYSISHNDFFSESKMLVILDKKGDVAAYSGGTVAGGGTVGLQTAASVATAGSILYGAKAIQHGLENASVAVKGVPSSVNVTTDNTFHIK